ncbi:hypothetical protein AEM51_13315 [Bacteroidetes bacterium UKL13-3]|jgi:predicted transcriptional regulator|nr:hypothetical protein AEM51_13315 [Bacteroidetes bacterium UKL13-3]
MNADSLKIKIAQKVLNTNDTTLIKQLDAVMKAHETDFWDELTAEQQASITRGKAQIKAGKGLNTEEVLSKYKRWLTVLLSRIRIVSDLTSSITV